MPSGLRRVWERVRSIKENSKDGETTTSSSSSSSYPPHTSPTLKHRLQSIKTALKFFKTAYLNPKNRKHLPAFYELFTGTAQQILDRYFKSELLKTTLATDAVIGAMISPTGNGSSYVLLHHCMGEAAGKKGVWSYMRGGMGTISTYNI